MNLFEKHLEVERFHDASAGARQKGQFALVGALNDCDKGHAKMELAKTSLDFPWVHVREFGIEDNNVEIIIEGSPHSLMASLHPFKLIAIRAEHIAEACPNGSFVFYN